MSEAAICLPSPHLPHSCALQILTSHIFTYGHIFICPIRLFRKLKPDPVLDRQTDRGLEQHCISQEGAFGLGLSEKKMKE